MRDAKNHDIGQITVYNISIARCW